MSDKKNHNSDAIVTLNKFLNTRYTTSDTISHLKLGKPGGRYYISKDDLAQFYELYDKAIGKGDLHIVERPMEYSPFIIDIDYDTVHKDRIYTNADILTICKFCRSLIVSMFMVRSKAFRIFIMEKDAPSKKGDNKYKDGFHILFPSIGIHTYMRFYILTQLSNELKKIQMFSGSGCKNDYSKIVDLSIVRNNGITMYESTKPESKKYVITAIYNGKMENLLGIESYTNLELLNVLSNRRYVNNSFTERKESFPLEDFNKIMSNMEKIHGKKGDKRIVEDENKKVSTKQVNEEEGFSDSDEENNDSKSSNKNKSKEKFDFVNSDNERLYKKVKAEKISNADRIKLKDIEVAKKLAAILSKKRAADYHTWLYAGWALYNISDTLLDTFKLFSKKCGSKYDPAVCESVWNKAKSGDNCFGMPSLQNWAREDNAKEYMNILRESMNEFFVRAEEGCDYDLAKLVYELYKYRFKCVSIKHNIWYEFIGHRWTEVENGYTLNALISDGLVNEFLKLSTQYIRNFDEDEGHMKRDAAMKKSNDIVNLTKKLRKDSFKNSVINQCKILFLDKKFEEKLDSNKDLIGFENGVFDIKNGIFRDGMTDDHITFNTGYDYIKYKHTDPEVIEIKEYLSTIQRAPDMAEYLLILISSYISGHNKDQQFIIWTGIGSNGKSLTVTILKFVFGDYFGVLPNKLLTAKRAGAGTATPELAETKGKRLVVFQEPENDDIIQVGYMKELSGSDDIVARKLFRDPFTFTPQFKMILTCNKLPSIPSTDRGTWRRIRVTPFDSEFVDVNEKGNHALTNRPLSSKQFPKKYDFEEKMERWRSPFMWLLIDTYLNKYKGRCMKDYEPAKVTSETKQYEKKSDVIYGFIDQLYEFTSDKKDTIRFKELYDSFREYFKENHASTGIRMQSASEFELYFKNKDNIYSISPSGKAMRCIRPKMIVETEEDDDNDSEITSDSS